MDEELDTNTVKQPLHKRLAFWRAALPTLFSLLALAAALTLLLVPRFHFDTTVSGFPEASTAQAALRIAGSCQFALPTLFSVLVPAAALTLLLARASTSKPR